MRFLARAGPTPNAISIDAIIQRKSIQSSKKPRTNSNGRIQIYRLSASLNLSFIHRGNIFPRSLCVCLSLSLSLWFSLSRSISFLHQRLYTLYSLVTLFAITDFPLFIFVPSAIEAQNGSECLLEEETGVYRKHSISPVDFLSPCFLYRPSLPQRHTHTN